MSNLEIGPYDEAWGLAGDVVSVVLLSIGVVAASFIEVALYHLDNRNKLRCRILMALFSAHIWAGLAFLTPILASLSGHPPRDGSVACHISAVLAESATWSQYGFVISVAAVSYFLLLHPLSKPTFALERYWYLIVLVVLLLAGTVAGLQAAFYSPVYIGGFCWNASTGAKVNEILNFVPRAVVLSMIIMIYGRIYWFLRKRDRFAKSVGLAAIPRAPIYTAPQNPEDRPWERLHLPGLSQFGNENDQDGEGTSASSGTGSKQTSATNSSTLLPSNGTEGRAAFAHPLRVLLFPKLRTKFRHFILGTSQPRNDLSEKQPSGRSERQPSTSSTPSRQPQPLQSQHSNPSIFVSDSMFPSIYGRSQHEAPAPITSDSFDLFHALAIWPEASRYGQRDPYATGHGHTPYHGPLPIARQRAKTEYFESLHDMLTRKASTLFLLFPLTYLILTIISAARLIDDFVSPHPSPIMRAVSRWALFLQGPLDALTYGVFAFKVKKSVGKEIKRRWPWLSLRDGDAPTAV
ncbi:hypothetical protein DL93DRAFT_2095822 [Clavulina sp. PMI_390]|nr:hypothetical protein DL93DRAFT_2095822 [Clavulina sp. PMI_390]